MPFDASRILLFRAWNRTGGAGSVEDPFTYAEDTSAIYAMIDAELLAEALEGRTPTVQNTINSYRYEPTPADFAERGFPQWAGNDPAAVYFKVPGTTAQQNSRLRTALAKRWREVPAL